MSRRRCASESAVGTGAPQKADLLKPDECAKVCFVMSLCEVTRDTALVTLASHRWNLPAAVEAFFEAAHPAPLPAPGPERPGAEGICQHCARTQGRRQKVCCACCPQSHTHTCEKRNRRRQSTGYVIVRAPLHRPERLGLHRVSWAEQRARTLAGASLGRGVELRWVRTDREAQHYWTQAGNLGPMPMRG